MGRKATDLIGHKFGRLTVVERSSNDKQGKPQWLCKCQCGNEVVVRGYILKRGDTTSCGCFAKEKRREMNKKMWEDDNFRQMQSNKAKEQWGDDNFRQMQSDKMKERWKDEEFKQKQSNGTKEKWKDEEYRQMQSKLSSERIKRMWEDEEFRQTQSDKGKLMSGENHPSWKGGITTISSYLRNLPVVSQWKKDTYARENSRCQLTGKYVHGGNSVVHHLYGFNLIVLDAHKIHNIEIKQQVKDYTEEELHKLEEYVTNWHKDTSNAVLLCDEVHDLFHRAKDKGGYGYGNNKPEQFEEFKQRYIEFKNKEGKTNE